MKATSSVDRLVRHLSQGRPLAAVVLALLALEIVLGQMSVSFSPPGTKVAAYWPNSGVSVVAAILTLPRWRPATILGVFLVTLPANMLAGRAFEVSLGFALANSSEAALVIWLLSQGMQGRPALRTIDDFIRLFVAAALGSGLGALLAGATVGLLENGDALITLRAVFASHAAAIVLIAPLAMALPKDRERLAGPMETAGQWLALGATVVALFAGRQDLPLVFVVYPLLVWGALRLQPRIAVWQLLLTGALTSALTTSGRGPFALSLLNAERAPELIGTLLQAHLIASALVTIPLALMKTQRLGALEELTRSHDEMDAILAATTGTAIIGVSGQGHVEYVNIGAEKLTGYAALDVIGRSSIVVSQTSGGERTIGLALGQEPDVDSLAGLVDPFLEAAGGTFTSDWSFIKADGGLITTSVAISRRFDPSGLPAGYLAVAEDVTERRRQEREVKDALAYEKLIVDRLAQLDQTKNDFLATVSHELRTPITSILGYSQLLQGQGEDDIPPIQRQIVGRIERNGRRLLGLIEDMLAMSQIEVGSFAIIRTPLDLRDTVAAAIESTLPLLPARDLRLTVEVTDDAVKVSGDSDKLERAFEHLLTNAVKFSNEGGEVTAGLRATPTEAVFWVTDTGIGIAHSDQEQLFDRFFRGAEAQNLAIQGAGLGLPIAATIVNGHGGRIEIDSTPGKGSTFSIRLPLLVETDGG